MFRHAFLLLTALGLGACGETSLDVITGVASGGSGGLGSDGGSGGDARPEGGPPCQPVPFPFEGRFRVQQATSLRCLRAGAPTLLMGSPGYLVDLDSGCESDPFAVWDLIAIEEGRFEIRNVGTQTNLDVQFASVTSGTPVVLYQPTPLRNQQFTFRPLGSSRFGLAAAHALNQCVAERFPHPEIWPCSPSDPSQAWQLLPDRCPL